MSTPIFLAWWLAATAVAALLFFLLDRLRSPARREFGRLEPISQIAMFVSFGGYTVALMPGAPAWTAFLTATPLLALGLVQLVNARKDPASYPSQPGLSYLLIAIGSLALAREGYHYAISLGTAASWSVR